MKVFGCTAFKHIETHQDKLSDNATNEVFVGYSEDSEAYILYNPYSKKTSFSRNVSFDETSFDFFAAHPSQTIRAFVTEKQAPKQILTETQKHFCEKSSVPILPTETLNDFETETTPSPLMLFHLKTLMPMKVVLFGGLEVGELSNRLRI